MRVCVAAMVLMLATTMAAAQGPCEAGWLAGEGAVGVRFLSTATMWDADGDGPLPAQLVIGGSFTTVAGVAANGIARWDGLYWQPFGSGLSGSVFALTTWDPDGDGPQSAQLVAGGEFIAAGGVTVNNIARWDGMSWQPLGTGMVGGRVLALTTWDPDGDGPQPAQLVAGGTFVAAGGVTVNRIALWDGSTWQALGSGVAGPAPEVKALATFDPDGCGPNRELLVAGGFFASAGGVTVNGVASWNGTSWQPYGNGLGAGFRVANALAVFDPDGDGPLARRLIVAGSFASIDGILMNNIAQWDGTAWQPVGSGFNASVFDIAVIDTDADGPEPPKLFAGGGFGTSGGVTVNAIARWDGVTWLPMDGGMTFEDGSNGSVGVLIPFDIDAEGPNLPHLLVGGSFTFAGDSGSNGLARWNGTSWQPFSSGIAGSQVNVHALATWDPNGEGELPIQLVAGGKFNAVGSVTVNGIARWDGVSWQPFGTGMNTTMNSAVLALTMWDPDGDGPESTQLVAGGSFTSAGGVTVNGIARWDGAAWHPLGSGMTFFTGFSGVVNALTVYDPDGTGPATPELIAGGSFTHAGTSAASNIARWNGMVWQSLGTGTDLDVYALTTFDPDGDGPLPAYLVAGGVFETAGGIQANGIARWNGSVWQPLSSGLGFRVDAVSSIDHDSDGPLPPQLVAGGSFGFTSSGGVSVQNIARWDGTSWQPLGTGMNGTVKALTKWYSDGDGLQATQLVAGGYFTTAGGVTVNGIARWDGHAWQNMGSGTNGGVDALTTWSPDGDGSATPRLVVGGIFMQAGGLPSGHLAQFGRDAATWSTPTSGFIFDPSRWLCGIEPFAFDKLIVDATQAKYAPSSFTISLPNSADMLDANGLRVRTDTVTLDLRATSLSLNAPARPTSAPLSVGAYIDQPTALTITNSLGTPAAVLADSASIGESPSPANIPSTLTVDGPTAQLDLAGDLTVGQRAANSAFAVLEGADAIIEGSISLGVDIGSGGAVVIQNSGSALHHGEQGRSLAIGSLGVGAWTIGGQGSLAGATAASIGRLENVLLGLQPGSSGLVSVQGPGSSWTLQAKAIDIGRAGEGLLSITGGAVLDTDATEGVSIARLSGSAGSVVLRGSNSRWLERSGRIAVGPNGAMDVGSATFVEADTIEILEGGLLAGSGSVGNPAPAGIISTGLISPSSDAGPTGDLFIAGNLLLCDVGCLPAGACCTAGVCSDSVSGASCFAAGGIFYESVTCADCPCVTLGRDRPDTGLLAIDIASGTDHDHLLVGGTLTLGGALVVRLLDGYAPDLAQSFTPIMAASVQNQFDVAFFPRFSADPKDDRFFRVVYGSQIEACLGVSLQVDSLSNLLDLSGAQNFSVGGRPNAAALGDVDGDGDLDLAVVVPDADPEQNGRLILLFNQTNAGASFGGFQVGSIEYPTGPDPSAVAIGDLNVLPGPEIAVTNRGADSVRLFNNNGGGIFTPAPSDLTVGAAPADVVIIDLDGDGVNDLVVANSGSNTLASLRNLGGGSFGVPSFIIVGDMPVDIDTTDLDNDKDIDIVVANAGGNTVSLVTSDGSGGLFEAASLPVGDEPVAVTVAFLDDDLFPDIVTTDRSGNTVSVLRSQNALQYAPSVQLPVGLQPRSIAAVDLDNDGDLDLAVVADDPVDGPVVQVIRNDSPAGQLAFAAAANLAAGATPILVLAGDVDNQGGEDLVTINDATVLAAGAPGSEAGSMPQNDVSVLLNLPPEPCGGDANGDGVVNGADLSVLLGQFGQSVTPGTGADFNGDGLVNGADLSVLLGRFGTAC